MSSDPATSAPASTGTDAASGVLAVGSYTSATGGRGAGVTLLERDPGTGRLGAVLSVDECPSPSFLAAGPGGVLHAAHELDEGVVSSRRFADGRWELLAQVPSGGASPCHLSAAPSGALLVAANYGGGAGVVGLARGAVSGLEQVLHAQGSGPEAERQEASHPHSTLFLDERHVVVCDLGTDELRVHAVEGARLSAEPVQVLALAPGTGPRHARLHGGRLHVAGELAATVTSLAVDGGRLSDPVVHPALAVPVEQRTYPSEVAAAPWGLVVANRRAEVLTLHEVVDGTARPVRDVAVGALNPRHVAVLGHHVYVAAQDSDLVVHLALDDDLVVVDRSTAAVGSPTCVVALRA
ncbi:beta-propeller fold lactonase family protein [Kineococcus sp. T13]|uniref:beta-propeller fold lactonase family protein n=1 Tax=Kineococcus vitellinus TaxID=2696565 RepID=UPI0014130B3C|nr:beta-propeller fold lactonase family protein [Kineococcus vitellinus]